MPRQLLSELLENPAPAQSDRIGMWLRNVAEGRARRIAEAGALLQSAEDELSAEMAEEGLRQMAEAGLPLLGQEAPEPRDLTPLASMREAGLPLRDPEGWRDLTGPEQRALFESMSADQRLMVADEIIEQRADELTELTGLPWKADAEILHEDMDQWRAASAPQATTGARAIREAGLPLQDDQDGDEEEERQQKERLRRRRAAAVNDMAEDVAPLDAGPDFEPDLPDDDLDAAGREEYDDLDDDDDELESASSLNSGTKQRRKAASARQMGSGQEAQERTESARSLNHPTDLVREAGGLQALADAGCADFYLDELPPRSGAAEDLELADLLPLLP